MQEMNDFKILKMKTNSELRLNSKAFIKQMVQQNYF